MADILVINPNSSSSMTRSMEACLEVLNASTRHDIHCTELAKSPPGIKTGFAFPKMMADVVRHSAGAFEKAQDIFDAYLPLLRYEQQPGIGFAVRKYVLAKRGAIASANQRSPGAALTHQAVAEIERLLARQERRLADLG